MEGGSLRGKGGGEGTAENKISRVPGPWVQVLVSVKVQVQFPVLVRVPVRLRITGSRVLFSVVGEGSGLLHSGVCS